MPDPRPRVFISSVMDGYGPFRDAAAEGIRHVGTRRYAEAPRSSRGGIRVPGECPRDPLVVFDRPRKVSRSDFDNPAGEIDRSLTMMKRAFQE